MPNSSVMYFIKLSVTWFKCAASTLGNIPTDFFFVLVAPGRGYRAETFDSFIFNILMFVFFLLYLLNIALLNYGLATLLKGFFDCLLFEVFLRAE